MDPTNYRKWKFMLVNIPTRATESLKFRELLISQDDSASNRWWILSILIWMLWKHLSQTHSVKTEYSFTWMFSINAWFIFSSPKDSCQIMTENLWLDGSVHLKKKKLLLWKFDFGMNCERFYVANKYRWVKCFTYHLDELTVSFYTSSGIGQTILFGAQRISICINPCKELHVQTALLHWRERKKTPCRVMEVEIFGKSN